MSRATELRIDVPDIMGLERRNIPTTPASIEDAASFFAKARLPLSDYELEAQKARHRHDIESHARRTREQRIAATGIGCGVAILAMSLAIGFLIGGENNAAKTTPPDPIEAIAPELARQPQPRPDRQTVVDGICTNMAENMGQRNQQVDPAYFQAMCENYTATPRVAIEASTPGTN